MAQQLDFQKLPPLKALKGFEAAARLLSLRQAAEELHLTHAAISHQIRSLEDDLGTELFTRNGRNIVLTPQGEQFYPVIREAIEMLINGAEAVRRTSNPSTLSVQTYVTVAIRWLSRRLPRFRTLHPDLDLNITSKVVNRDFDEANADVGLIYNAAPLEEHLHWIPLMPSRLFAVCSPELIAQHQGQMQPGDILNYPMINISTEFWQWRDWFEPQGLGNAQVPEESIVVDTTATALEMAIDGEGIALVNGPFADNDLAAGRLICPIDHEVTIPGEWGIICRKDMLEDSRVKAFISWLLDDVEQFQR